jgi:NAD+-dependent farnesol dehydrogenase
MKILLTGASGFLGGKLAELLAPAHELRLLYRAETQRAAFPAGAEAVRGDLRDAASLERAMAGCGAAIHAAALVKILAPARDFDAVNVEGLRNVLAAAEKTRLPRLVYVSSFMALGPTEKGPGGELDERAPAAERDFVNDYERTKTRADRLAREAIEAGRPLDVVYPGVIYGPGSLTEGNIIVRHLLDLAGGKLPALLGKPERRWNYVFVDDVAGGIVRLLEGTPGRRYILGGENVLQEEFYALVARLGKIKVPSLRMPDWLAKTSGFAMKSWAQMTGGTPQLTPDLVEVYRHDWAYSSAKAGRELGYAPRQLAEGMGLTLDWLRREGRWPA